MERQILIADEVAKLLRIDRQRVYELVRRNLIPVIRLGVRQYRFDAEAIRQWMECGGSSVGFTNTASSNGGEVVSKHLTPLEAACDILRRRWMPLPVPFKSKNPNFSGWQNFSITENELPTRFNGRQQNIGVLLGAPSSDLLDIDLDCPVAVTLAHFFLPPTGAIFGRESRRQSHWLYYAKLATRKFSDPLAESKQSESEQTKAMIVEIRSTGAQTIFPGSVHPSGEAVTWDSDRTPAIVGEKELEMTVARLASAVLFARYWPTGRRNDAANAIAGALLRAEWSEDEIAYFIEAVCHAACDEETRSRIRNVVDTAAKLNNGEHVTGWPTLAKIIDERIVNRVCEWLGIQRETPKQQRNSVNGNGQTEQVDDSLFKIVCMADVKPETVRWLWYPYIPLGKLTLIEGDPGLGKSWLTCAIAAGVSCGRGLPGAGIYEPGNVLMLSAEDGLGDTLRPRLDAVGADVSRVHALAEIFTLDVVGLIKLEAAIIEYKPALILIDPFFAYTGGKVDIHRANECRAISAPLAAIAERQGCAIVAVRHLGKSRGGGHALNAGVGSIDFTAAARSVLLAGADPDESNKRAIVQIKNNLAPHGEAVGYALQNDCFYWTGTSTLTADRILSLPSIREKRSSLTDAKDFLLTALKRGAKDSDDLKDEAKQAGISERTLFRAKQELKIKAEKRGQPGSDEQKWVWKLPDEECHSPVE